MRIKLDCSLYFSYWPLLEDEPQVNGTTLIERLLSTVNSESNGLLGHFMKLVFVPFVSFSSDPSYLRWIVLSSDHIVTLVLLLALLAKFAIFENKDEIDERVREASNISKGSNF